MRTFNPGSLTALFAAAALIQLAGTPVLASAVDDRIEAAAKNSYNFKTFLKDDKIKVASKDGVVTLTGSVSEDLHKALAQETVAGLPGVKKVDNQLAVTGEQPMDRSDSWISMKVKTALTFHKNVSAASTDVNTVNGVVTLSGSAASEAQKQLTSEYAKEVDGVIEVRNNLVVTKPTATTLGEKVDDASITAQIKTSLLFHKSTHTLATKVVTKDGVVTLRGEARNAAEKDLVTKLSEDVSGVKLVHNLMIVPKS